MESTTDRINNQGGKMKNQLQCCGNCKSFKALKIVPFIKGWWVGDGRCLLGPRSLKKGRYRTVGDSCDEFEYSDLARKGKEER